MQDQAGRRCCGLDSRAAVAQDRAMATPTVARRPVPPGARSDDELAVLTPAEAAGWYRRLAQLIAGRQTGSLAAKMLLHWLDGKGLRLTFDASYVKDLGYVTDYLRDEVRPVFLTEKEATLKGGKRWAGIVPRLKGTPPYPLQPKDAVDLTFSMLYEGPSVSIPMTIQAKALAGFADAKELDLFMSLHTFGLHTDVSVHARRRGATQWDVTFESWQAKAFDRYDWDPNKYLTVPNPDYGNPSKVAYAVAPTSKTIRVYHSNAKRVEAAGFAAAYDAESTSWAVKDATIVGPAVVDTSRSF